MPKYRSGGAVQDDSDTVSVRIALAAANSGRSEPNNCYRWFPGYTLQEEMPHFSTVSYNSRHRFTVETVEQVFAWILSEAVDADREAHGKKPFDDANNPPASHGKRSDNTSKKRPARRKKEKTLTVMKSITDPDCGLFVKGGHKRKFAYEAHTACGKKRLCN